MKSGDWEKVPGYGQRGVDILADLASAEARIAEVEGERDLIRTAQNNAVVGWDKEKARSESAKKRLAEVVEALELAEWGDFDDGANYCPVCGSRQEHGHAETCEIKAALAHAHEEEKHE